MVPISKSLQRNKSAPPYSYEFSASLRKTNKIKIIGQCFHFEMVLHFCELRHLNTQISCLFTFLRAKYKVYHSIVPAWWMRKKPELQDSMSFEHYCPKAMIAKWIYWTHIFSQMWLCWGFQCIFVSWIDRLCFLLFIRCKICQFYWGTIIHIKVSLTSAKNNTAVLRCECFTCSAVKSGSSLMHETMIECMSICSLSSSSSDRSKDWLSNFCPRGKKRGQRLRDR